MLDIEGQTEGQLTEASEFVAALYTPTSDDWAEILAAKGDDVPENVEGAFGRRPHERGWYYRQMARNDHGNRPRRQPLHRAFTKSVRFRRLPLPEYLARVDASTVVPTAVGERVCSGLADRSGRLSREVMDELRKAREFVEAVFKPGGQNAGPYAVPSVV